MATAVGLTLVALLQQVAYACGLLHGSLVPILRGSPLPLLLVAAPLWLLARPWTSPMPTWLQGTIAAASRVPVWLFGIVILSGTVALWAAVQHTVPSLGHDEAVYATKARSWLTGAPAAQWGVYRPVGLPALGWVALALRNDVGSLRLLALGLAVTTLAITYLVAARLTTPRRAALVVLVVVGGWGFLRRLPEFHNDIATAGLLVAIAFLMLRSRQRPGSYLLVAAAAVAVAAFYVRYGVLSGLAALVVAGLVAWGPRAWLSAWRQVVAAAGLFAAGLVPHLVHSSEVEGSPAAVLLAAGDVAHRAYVGDGLVYYALVFPFRIAGDLGGVVMAAGLIAAALAARRVLRSGPGRPVVPNVPVTGPGCSWASPPSCTWSCSG